MSQFFPLETMSGINVTEATVFEELCELKVNKAPGPFNNIIISVAI